MSGIDQYKPKPYVRITHPEWSKNATIYQINTRQFTAEGTFRAAEEHLPRLKELGAVILWLMPVQVIGEKNRKGTLGSPYAVKDYYAVEPDLGTLDDLKHFVRAAHEHGLYVILDWVANHTAWDSNLVTEHPEWYARDWKGDYRPTPWWDWVDIIDLDYANADLRQVHDRRHAVLGVRGRHRRLSLRCRWFCADRLLGHRPCRTRRDQTGFHAGRVGVAGSACRRLRHDLRMELERDTAPDRDGQGGARAAPGVLRLEREGISRPTGCG